MLVFRFARVLFLFVNIYLLFVSIEFIQLTVLFLCLYDIGLSCIVFYRFDTVYLDNEIRVVKDIRGDYLVVERAPYSWKEWRSTLVLHFPFFITRIWLKYFVHTSNVNSGSCVEIQKF